MPFTQVEAPGDFDGAREIWSCNDCGAHAASTDLVVHHKTCVAGESEKWEKHYSTPPREAVPDCEFFEIIDWDEETQEIYYAMCTRSSPNWANCNSCTDRIPGPQPDSAVLLSREGQVLTRADVDILDGSRNRSVRIGSHDDAQVKVLYDMYKQL